MRWHRAHFDLIYIRFDSRARARDLGGVDRCYRGVAFLSHVLCVALLEEIDAHTFESHVCRVTRTPIISFVNKSSTFAVSTSLRKRSKIRRRANSLSFFSKRSLVNEVTRTTNSFHS